MRTSPNSEKVLRFLYNHESEAGEYFEAFGPEAGGKLSENSRIEKETGLSEEEIFKGLRVLEKRDLVEINIGEGEIDYGGGESQALFRMFPLTKDGLKVANEINHRYQQTILNWFLVMFTFGLVVVNVIQFAPVEESWKYYMAILFLTFVAYASSQYTESDYPHTMIKNFFCSAARTLRSFFSC